jgi:hypothetical protein
MPQLRRLLAEDLAVPLHLVAKLPNLQTLAMSYSFPTLLDAEHARPAPTTFEVTGVHEWRCARWFSCWRTGYQTAVALRGRLVQLRPSGPAMRSPTGVLQVSSITASRGCAQRAGQGCFQPTLVVRGAGVLHPAPLPDSWRPRG